MLLKTFVTAHANGLENDITELACTRDYFLSLVAVTGHGGIHAFLSSSEIKSQLSKIEMSKQILLVFIKMVFNIFVRLFINGIQSFWSSSGMYDSLGDGLQNT